MIIETKNSTSLHVGLSNNLNLNDMLAMGSVFLALISSFFLNLAGVSDTIIVFVGLFCLILSITFKYDFLFSIGIMTTFLILVVFHFNIWLYVIVFLGALIRVVLLVRKTLNNAFFSMFIIGMALILFSSVTIIKFEVLETSNIKNIWDAVWWTICTMTTVGYGDKFPITDGGRVIALILMLSGIGLYGGIVGYFSSHFTDKEKENNNNVDTIEELSKQIAELKNTIEQINTKK